VRSRGGAGAGPTIEGVPLPDDALRELAGELKRRCGSGGTAKDGVIEIRAITATRWSPSSGEGYTVKRAGG
jgi:translation initiation factor 1